MSVLIQRPQQTPAFHRPQHAILNTPSKRAPTQHASPRQQPRRPTPNNRTAAQVATTTIPSDNATVPTRPKRRNAPTTPTPVPVLASTYSLSHSPAINTVKSPLDLSSTSATPPVRKSTNTAATKNKAHTQERRRDRARSPPEFPYDDEQITLNHRSAPTSPAAAGKRDQRNRRAPTSPAVAQLFAASTASPAPAPVLTPAFNIPVRPTTTHQRAPSYPTLPIYHDNAANPFFVNGANPLEALFASQLNLSPSPAVHARTPSVPVSASLPMMGLGIHAHMKDREPRQRTLTGNNNGRGFAGASFQHAPDAMVMGLPFPGKMKGGLMSPPCSSSEESSSDSDGGVVNLDEEDDGLFF